MKRFVVVLLGVVLGMGVPPTTTPVQASIVGQKLTLERSSTEQVVSGAAVAFAGTAPARFAGKRVRLMRRVGRGEWVAVARTRVRDDGSYALSGPATGVGANSWRTLLNTRSGSQLSNIARTTVYRWFVMDADNAVDYDSFWLEAGPLDIGSRHFTQAIWYDGAYSGEPIIPVAWNLSYKCTTFSASIGLGNDSATDGTGYFSYSLDGATTDLGARGLGDPMDVVADVTSRMRITLNLSGLNAGSGDATYPAVAGPQVLCHGDPF